MSTDCKPFRVIYEFNFTGGIKKPVCMDFRPDNYEIIVPRSCINTPVWAGLEYKKCPHCNLDPETTAFCPVAFNISGIMTSFGRMISTERCFVRCQTYERAYSKTTDLMSGLASVLALVILASPCQHLLPFRPLARFHLPFYTPEETLVRMVSFFLLSRHFCQNSCETSDEMIKKLNESIECVKTVQENLMSRVKNLFAGDACTNALHMFHVLIQFLGYEIESALEAVRPFFYHEESTVCSDIIFP